MSDWQEITRKAEALMERYQRDIYRPPTAWDWLKAFLIRLGGRADG